MKFKAIAAVAAFSIASPCFATNDIDSLQSLVQTEFKSFSQDLGAALSYKAVSPAEPMGLTGFDIGLEVTGTKLNHSDIWDKASSGSAPSTVPVPKLHVIKGLPFNFDVGAVYTKIPTTNISLLGGELRYAILEGGVASPGHPLAEGGHQNVARPGQRLVHALDAPDDVVQNVGERRA